MSYTQTTHLGKFKAFYDQWSGQGSALPSFEVYQDFFKWVGSEIAVFEPTPSGFDIIEPGDEAAKRLHLAKAATPKIPANLLDELKKAAKAKTSVSALLPIKHGQFTKFVNILCAPFTSSEGGLQLVVMTEEPFNLDPTIADVLDLSSQAILKFVPLEDNAPTADYVLAYANKQAEEIFNTNAKTLIGQKLSDLFADNDMSDAAEFITQKRAKKSSPKKVFSHQEKGKKPSWLEVAALGFNGGITVTLTDVTALYQAQQDSRTTELALETQLQIYRSLVNSNADMIVRTNLQGEVVFANASYAEKNMIDRDQMIGKPISDFCQETAEDTKKRLAAALRAAKKGEPYDYELSYVNQHGLRRRVFWTDTVITDHKGDPVQIQSVGRNITSLHQRVIALRRLSALAFRNSKGLKSQLDQLLTIGLDLFQMDNGIITTIQGENFEILAGKGLYLPELDIPIPLKNTICQHMVKTHDAVFFADRAEARAKNIPDDLTPHYEAFIGVPVFLQGRLFGTLNFKCKAPHYQIKEDDLALLRLLASFISIALERQNQKMAIDARNEYFKRLFRKAPVMMHSTDRDGTIVTVSEAWASHFGYASTEVVGRNISEFIVNPPSTSFSDEAKIGMPCGDWAGQVYFWKRKNGSRFEGEVSAVYMDDPISNQTLALWVVLDVTVRNHAMRQVQEANLSLSDMNERLKSFAYIASHDLQEPLRKMRSFSGHLREELGDGLNEEAEFCLTAIERASDRMSNLVRDLLTYSRESNKDLVLQPVDFDSILANVLHDLSGSISEAGLKVEKQLPLGQFCADERAVNHLLLNIVQNAIKYRALEKDPVLKVHRTEQDDCVVMEFEDNGIGFEQEWADKIFLPFYRLHGKSDRPGSGIGLAVCKTIAERHGWKLLAIGIPNVGARFQLHIKNANNITKKK